MVPLMLVVFIATLDQTIVATALPGIGEALHDLASAPWIATSYLLTSAVSTLILGKLGDIYGRKRVFQFSVVVFLIGSLLSGLANSMSLLIAARALQGIGGGGLSPLVQAITGDLVRPASAPSTRPTWVSSPPWPSWAGRSWAACSSTICPGGDLLHQPAGGPRRAGDHRRAAAAALPPVPAPGRCGRGGITVTLFTTAALLVTVWGGSRYGWGRRRCSG